MFRPLEISRCFFASSESFSNQDMCDPELYVTSSFYPENVCVKYDSQTNFGDNDISYKFSHFMLFLISQSTLTSLWFRNFYSLFRLFTTFPKPGKSVQKSVHLISEQIFT